MNFKPEKKKFSLLKGFIIFEVATLVGSYLVWKRLNTSQDFRYYMSQKAPFILEGYYQMGEQIGNLKTREYDLDCWAAKKK